MVWKRQKAHVRVKARRARPTAMDGGSVENAGAIFDLAPDVPDPLHPTPSAD